MTLPSSRRPASVEQEMQAAMEKDEATPPEKGGQDLSITLDKKKLFMNIMIDWHKNKLTDRKRRHLTPLKLKRKAVSVLFTLKYPYLKLPLDWVQQLRDATGMILYKKKKVSKDYDFAKDEGIVSLNIDPLNMPKVVIPLLDSQEDVGEIMKPGNNIPFYDLSQEPPPPEWLEAYAKGEHKRRELSFSFGETRNIVFWDYDPIYKEEFMSTMKQIAHNSNSFNWFADYSSRNKLKQANKS